MPATLNPQIVVEKITNAVVSFDGKKTISNGSISWSITAEGIKLEPTYTNWKSAWNPNYEWTGISKEDSFNGLSTIHTISTMVSYTKHTVQPTSNVKQYNNTNYETKQKADEALNEIMKSFAGSNKYYLEVKGSGGAYGIYQIDLETVTDP